MDHPLRQFSERIPSVPGHPHYCPECPGTRRFRSEDDRDLHYLQRHVLRIPTELLSNRDIMIDNGNYDGPLGKKQHVLPAKRYFQEPESFWTEAGKRCDEEWQKKW
jgi:hypothetical protein